MSNSTNVTTTPGIKNNYTVPIIIIGVLFFILGFITWLNGMLIPYLKTACELTNFQALFVTFAFYISYTVMALPASWILKKVGFKTRSPFNIAFKSYTGVTPSYFKNSALKERA